MSPSRSPRTPSVARLALGTLPLVGALASACGVTTRSATSAPDAAGVTFDVVLRGGTVIDGSGAPRYVADVAIDRGRIARIGDLSRDRGTTELDARGLVVAPGFINAHSHAIPAALPTAANMLTQGVTTELLNADGGGPTDIGRQLQQLEGAGLAVNVAASAGFNSIWSSVVGPSDRRPTAEEIDRMRALLVSNLERGAFGVSAGLDYKPAYFATADEVVRILEPAARWRTFFPNHDRSTPEAGFSARAAIDETIDIGTRAGLVPTVTHMKVYGREQGTASTVLEMMQRASADGRWIAADVYPYLAGQTGLHSLIIPGWAQDGGVAKMRERFRDSTTRARIIAESNATIAARFTGAESILVGGGANGVGQKLSDIMREQGVTTPAEAVVNILETRSPSAILGFGVESDLVKIMQYPSAAIACDCGAATGSRAHPRYYGTFPRVLGHYVRETGALTWEDAVRKMTGLPASMMGLVDRGLLAPGMAADVTVFDTVTVIDHATFERPDLPSEGIRHVLVNGKVALRDGAVTGERGGVALRRAFDMPSRPMRFDVVRSAKAEGSVAISPEVPNATVAIAVGQGAWARTATGSVRYSDLQRKTTIESIALGTLQTADGWASITGRARVTPSGEERWFTLILDEARGPRPARISLALDGLPPIVGLLDPSGITVLPKQPAGGQPGQGSAGSR